MRKESPKVFVEIKVSNNRMMINRSGSHLKALIVNLRKPSSRLINCPSRLDLKPNKGFSKKS